MSEQRIVRVGTLAEFIVDVDPNIIRHLNWTSPVVRLSLAEKRIKSQLPLKSVELHLQGINDQGEIIWLMEAHEVNINIITRLPDVGRDLSIYDSMVEARRIVEQHLIAHGYEVRGGSYGLPRDVEPISGHFECLKWIKNDDDTYTVVALDSNELPPPNGGRAGEGG